MLGEVACSFTPWCTIYKLVTTVGCGAVVVGGWWVVCCCFPPGGLLHSGGARSFPCLARCWAVLGCLFWGCVRPVLLLDRRRGHLPHTLSPEQSLLMPCSLTDTWLLWPPRPQRSLGAAWAKVLSTPNPPFCDGQIATIVFVTVFGVQCFPGLAFHLFFVYAVVLTSRSHRHGS